VLKLVHGGAAIEGQICERPPLPGEQSTVPARGCGWSPFPGRGLGTPVPGGRGRESPLPGARLGIGRRSAQAFGSPCSPGQREARRPSARPWPLTFLLLMSVSGAAAPRPGLTLLSSAPTPRPSARASTTPDVTTGWPITARRPETRDPTN
jgi:hypothetical protein